MRPSRSRFTLRQMMVAVVLTAVLAGCLVGLFRGVGWFPTPNEFAPQPTRANADHDVFDVVISDLLTTADFDPVGVSRGPKPYQIVFGDQTYGRVTSRRLTEVLGDRTKDVPAEIQADLVSRNPDSKGYLLARYRPSNPNILVRDMRGVDKFSKFDLQFPGAKGYVLPMLPGYSLDGRMALFYFYFGPTSHGAAGYYLLRKANGRWEIVLHGFYANPHET